MAMSANPAVEGAPLGANTTLETKSKLEEGIPEKEVESSHNVDDGPVESIADSDADETAIFYNTHKDMAGPLTPEIRKKILRKNFWYLIGQTWWVSLLIEMDKTTISQASTMGLFKDVHISKAQFNDLTTIFYVGYLVALWPGAILSQRIGHKRFIVGSLFLWALLLGVHPACKNGPQMTAVRFLLGFTESQIIPSTTVLHQGFFPPESSPWIQLVWWASSSFGNVLLTMVSYRLIVDSKHGSLAGHLQSWKWLHIFCAITTFCVFVPLLFFLPNTPLDAKWLSTEEKVHTIAMIRETRSGISNRTLKLKQVKECFLDPKSWLFILHLFFNELPNNTSQQLPLIIVDFGFTPAESALFNIAKPLWGLVLMLGTAAMIYGTRLGTGLTCAISYLPCVIGGIIMLASPWANKVALVVGSQISTFKPSYIMGLSWVGTTTTGHTKRIVLTSSCVVAAAVANMISPQFWQSEYKPRYILPWAFMTAFWIISPLMCVIIRFYLVRENKKREHIIRQGGEQHHTYVTAEKVKVEDADLDHTDRENLLFKYPL